MYSKLMYENVFDFVGFGHGSNQKMLLSYVRQIRNWEWW